MELLFILILVALLIFATTILFVSKKAKESNKKLGKKASNYVINHEDESNINNIF